MGLGLLHPPLPPSPLHGPRPAAPQPPQNNHSKMFPASGAKGETLGEGGRSSLPQPPAASPDQLGHIPHGSLSSKGMPLSPRLVLK